MLWLWQFTWLLWQHNGPPLRQDAKSEIVHRRPNLLRAILRCKVIGTAPETMVAAGRSRQMAHQPTLHYRSDPSRPTFFCCLAAGFFTVVSLRLLLAGDPHPHFRLPGRRPPRLLAGPVRNFRLDRSAANAPPPLNRRRSHRGAALSRKREKVPSSPFDMSNTGM